ncbi:uncharacterized protein LOC132731235 [Ruditapes philippinarum]|uniref:uncharacterized protein LOC132731235 n=1 Tax=Ruditapes philippinarum TaxID=129788 RepID=UPI00295B0640|nr:uncharacterized protein LOC132731235 [Ruditapes philippinarum]
MAEKKEKLTSHGISSLTQDSDEIKEMYCEECERDNGEYATAVAFCVDCVEYKCKTCREYHRRHFKTHKIQDSDSMPQDFYFEKCSTHPQQLIKFYCSECSKLACQDCKDNAHGQCGDVYHLPTVASGIQKSDDFKDLQHDLDELFVDIIDTEKLLEAKSEVVEKQEEKATEICKEHSNKLIKALKQQHQIVIDAFDKKMEMTIARLKKERLELVQVLSEKERKFENKITKAETDIKEEVVSTNREFKELKSEHLNLVGNFKALTADLEQAQKLGKKCVLFIKYKLIKQLCENLHRNIEQIHQANIQHYKIKISETQAKELSLDHETSFFTFENVHASAVERKVVFNFDISGQFDIISSLLVLSEHTLLILDWKKCNLVIYKLEKTQAICMDEIKFDTNPWDITKVSDCKVAITFLNEKMIILLKFSEDMKVLDITKIPGKGRCTGIAYKNNYFAVSYWGTGIVKILSMSGEVVKTFDKDDYGQKLFIDPCYLTVSPDNTMIYVSDCEKYGVICLTFDGKLKAVYKDDHLNLPYQLAVDEYGSVYACGVESDNVHQLSSDLTKVKILIDKSHGLDQPRCVAYCQNTKRLFVGMRNKIRVFNMSL